MFGLNSKAEPGTRPPFVDNTNKNLLEDFVTKAKQSEANDDLGL